MFSIQVVNSDAFLNLKHESQLLYFHLGLNADDRGYIANTNSILTTLGIDPKYLQELIKKRFILERPNGLILIKHWRINNVIRSDFLKETKYLKDFANIKIEPNDAYTEKKEEKGGVSNRGVSDDIELISTMNFKGNIINERKEIYKEKFVLLETEEIIPTEDAIFKTLPSGKTEVEYTLLGKNNEVSIIKGIVVAISESKQELIDRVSNKNNESIDWDSI